MNISDIKQEYDMVVIGGGITGAGVFHEAAMRGYNVLLVEAKDFAWGTSSRSSKMVHGGLRYLKQGNIFLTKASVKERERMLKKYPGLVTPLNFIMPIFDDYGPSESSMKIGLSMYSALAGRKQHRSYSKQEAMAAVQGIKEENLVSAVGFMDAQVDDARLVLRIIQEACTLGGTALNYAKAVSIERNKKNKVSALSIKDIRTNAGFEVKTKAVINATGAFAETLHPSPKKGLHIRPLRGSHLIFPKELLPFNNVISFIHPKDSRPVFLFPWEGCTCLGTTDIDHDQNMENDPFITMKEADYLLEGLQYIFPGLSINLNQCISSFAGVRPVLSKNSKKSASKESREHAVWKDNGLITVTGGKLTTFTLLANDALKAAKKYLPDLPEKKIIMADPGNFLQENDHGFSPGLLKRLAGRYGNMAQKITEIYDRKLFSPIEKTDSLWVELCYAAEHEAVHNLSDLLLRRVRIGLFQPRGAINQLDKIETICKPYLSWDKERWESEKAEYIRAWEKYYCPPNNMEC